MTQGRGVDDWSHRLVQGYPWDLLLLCVFWEVEGRLEL